MTFEVEQKLDESSQYTVETKLLEYKPEPKPKKVLEVNSLEDAGRAVGWV